MGMPKVNANPVYRDGLDDFPPFDDNRHLVPSGYVSRVMSQLSPVLEGEGYRMADPDFQPRFVLLQGMFLQKLAIHDILVLGSGDYRFEPDFRARFVLQREGNEGRSSSVILVITCDAAKKNHSNTSD